MGTLSDRFWSKVQKTETCWLWKGAVNNKGYGQFRLEKTVLAHRVAYELVKGPIPYGMELDHLADLCASTLCVNPDHLEPVTHVENCRRGKAGSHNKVKTHCPVGHLYEGRNLMIVGEGRRQCRACTYARTAARRAG